MATVRDLIRGSMRLIGAIATGETPSADELSDGLSALNDMLDSWSNESLIIYDTKRESFPLTSGQSVYTIGTGGNFNTPRPLSVDVATIEVGGTPVNEIPLKILSVAQWSQIAVKNTPSSIPSRIYIETSFPLSTINLWPVPSTSANNLVLYSSKALTSFSSVNDVIALPPGYAKALRYGLAIELAPEYGKTVGPEIGIAAGEARENIKRLNITAQYLETDIGQQRTTFFNWLTGE